MHRRRGARIMKRGCDLALASLLLVITAPLQLAIALAIKIDSPGTVLFRSPRIGRHGKLFGMLKFRTMVDEAHDQRDGLRHLSDAPEGCVQDPQDPRVTRVGSGAAPGLLDELPQLWHVITGEMSLVGPRPLPPEEDELIADDAAANLREAGRDGPVAGRRLLAIPLTNAPPRARVLGERSLGPT